jgi:hypothetical protein
LLQQLSGGNVEVNEGAKSDDISQRLPAPAGTKRAPSAFSSSQVTENKRKESIRRQPEGMVRGSHGGHGEAGLFEEFVGAAHAQRHALTGLEYEGVATGNRVREKPERDHSGKVEGSDGRDDAKGLADEQFVGCIIMRMPHESI